MALYLGIDSSTQSVKAEIIDTGTGTFVAGESVHFGTDLPEYRSPKGFLPNDDPLIRQSAPMMWLDGLELLFLKLKNSGVDLSRIKGISGSGQQHGSVYLNAGFESGLPMLDPAKRLSEQLAGTLARKVSPIWMDRSTEQECRELDERFGKRLQLDTGSPDGMISTSIYVETVQNREGVYIACIEEIAYRNGWISKSQLKALGEACEKTAYGQHLIEVAEEEI